MSAAGEEGIVCVERPETELIKADCNGSADLKASESKDTETEGCKASFAMSTLFAAGSTGACSLEACSEASSN